MTVGGAPLLDPAQRESHGGRQSRTMSTSRVVVAGMVGTVIEYFDFLIYATISGLVFGDLFFPSDIDTSQRSWFGRRSRSGSSFGPWAGSCSATSATSSAEAASSSSP
jgi:hypothetical protein